jgi:two-component system, chemotaxis family, sensor kinase CheA
MDPLAELKASFLEECDELLGALEARLTALRDGSTAMDDVNGAFRAIHSVKGGAGAFGLPALVELAHVFEAALDHLRAGRIKPEAAPYDLFLRALDQVSALITSARQGREMTAPADMVRELQKVGHASAAAGSDATQAIAPQAAPVPRGPLRISIRPQADLFRRAVDIRHVFASLEAMGNLTVRTETAQLPPLHQLNPLSCHLAFSLELDSLATEQQLAEVLEIQLDSSEFTIHSRESAVLAPAASPPEAPKAPAPPKPDGTILVRAPLNEALPAAKALPETPPAVSRMKAVAAGSIRVDLQRIDRLMNLVGEIVITQSMLDQRLLSLPTAATIQIADGLQVLARQTRELQDSVMAVRAQPVKNVFQRMPRLVRELCQALGKQARLQIIGEDTEVDKTIIEELADPLTHMIRNAMDHGMETPEERQAAGKPAEGLVTLQAEQRSGRIVISVADDGRGINRDRLLAKAKQRSLIAAAERPAPEDIDALLFHPGLSTAEAVTDVSGRGVGMDVVKQNVEALGGRVLVASEPGKGTRFTMLLPLTLAVMDGMIIRSGGQRLVLPIASIRETLQSAETPIECLPGGHEFLRLRERLSPIVRLGEVLGFGRSEGEQVIVMTETDRGSQIGLWVDEIIGQQQVVVKSLESSYGVVPGASAATILGDGLVALIIDVDAIPSICAPAFLALRTAALSTTLQ